MPHHSYQELYQRLIRRSTITHEEVEAMLRELYQRLIRRSTITSFAIGCGFKLLYQRLIRWSTITVSYLDLNTFTFDPKKGTLSNIGNKLIGKGQNIDDVLNQENQRLARKITRDEKISQARRENAENQISGYVYDTPVIHGGRGVLGRGSGEISPSVDKTSELVSQVDLVKRIKPTEATKRATGNDIAFDEIIAYLIWKGSYNGK